MWANNQTYQIPISKNKTLLDSQLKNNFDFISRNKKNKEIETIFRNIVLNSSNEFYFIPSLYCKESIFVNFLSFLNPILQNNGKNRILLSTTAEENFINIFQQLQYLNFAYDWVPCNKEGFIEKNDFIEAITPKTVLFSLSLADGLLGTIPPLEEIFPIIKERQILLHLDVSHYIKYLKINKTLINEIDIITFSGLPLGGCVGSGGIFIRKPLLKYTSLFTNNEYPIYPNTICINDSLVKEMILYNNSLEQNYVEIVSLRNYFEKMLIKNIPNIQILFTKQRRLPNTSTIIFNKIPSESLAFLLFHDGITCNLGFNQFQPLPQVLQSCGYSPLEAHSALSFSFSTSQDYHCIDSIISILKKHTENLIKQKKIF